jgi:hypothetical protein
MKKTTLFIAFLVALSFTGCQDVVAVDLITAEPKLVVEAAINWKKGTTGSVQKIILSTTADFYGAVIPKVSNAVVTIKSSNNTIFNFVESSIKGEYICSNFKPVLDESYTLTIIRNSQIYTAVEKMTPVAAITEIIQNNSSGFTGNEIQIKSYYLDPANQTNFYLYKYQYKTQAKSDFYVGLDQFYNGNVFFSISRNNELKKDDKVEITHFGISKNYYNYMAILVDTAGSGGGAPFQSPPATVRGNVINTTNSADYPLGYFSLSEVDTKIYTIQ